MPAAEEAAAAPSPAAFAGAPTGPLGVAAADLLAEALPPEAARRQALAAAAPALEAELLRRCRLVAAAAGYGSEAGDFSGLPDHIRQLLEARSQASQVAAWRKAAAQAQQATSLLAEAGELLARLIRRHKLEGQRVRLRCRGASCCRVAQRRKEARQAATSPRILHSPSPPPLPPRTTRAGGGRGCSGHAALRVRLAGGEDQGCAGERVAGCRRVLSRRELPSPWWEPALGALHLPPPTFRASCLTNACPPLPPCLPHLSVPQLQLQAATYTPEAVAALRQVAAEVGRALGQATAELQQVRRDGAGWRPAVPGLG